jgi:hypothetical protein
VSDKDIPTSGSRWEPAGNDAGRTPAPPQGTPVTPAEHEHPPPADLAPATRSGRRGGRAALAAVGAGLVLAGGFGGFALGHATAGDGTEVSDSGAVTDADGDGIPDGARDDGRGPGRDFDGDGPAAPPDATLPDDSGTTPETDDDADPA